MDEATPSGPVTFLCEAIRFLTLFAAQQVADWKLVLDVNLTGTYIVVRCCLPWLVKAPFATIVNIASGQGLLPNSRI